MELVLILALAIYFVHNLGLTNKAREASISMVLAAVGLLAAAWWVLQRLMVRFS